LTLVELALVLAIIVPFMLTALSRAQSMLRDWQVHEAASAAVRFIAEVDPASLVDAQWLDREVIGRCAVIAAQLNRHPESPQLEHCGRIGTQQVEVALVFPARTLFPAVSAKLQWRLHAPL
jgi:flagellar motor switch protein FliG